MTTNTLRSSRDRTADVVAAEWIKLRSVRSTYWAVLVGAVLTIAVGILTARNVVHVWPRLSPADRRDLDPLSISLAGLLVTQLGFGMLGVLAIGTEYGSGQIRTTFTVVPRRQRVLVAKAAAVGAVSFVVGALTAVVAFAGAQRILSARHVDVAISAPGVPRCLLAAALFLCLVALVGLGVGAVVRHSAGAVAILFSLVFVAPLVVQALPSPWDTRIEPYLISELGQQMSALRPAAGTLSPGVASAVCVAYAAVALGLAGLLVARRDA